jgi:hypothetical protein
MIASTPAGFAVVEQLAADGYSLKLEGDSIKKAKGPAPLSDEQRTLVKENRDAVKAALLLADPPAWLEKLFDFWWSGRETPVSLSAPSGKAEVYMVSVSVQNIAAAVAAAVGMDALEWQRIRPEVEEALGSWEEEA